MFLTPKNAEELRRLFESDTPILAFAFRRRAPEDWAPEHNHMRGQLFALTRGLLVVEAGSETMDVSLPALCVDSSRLHARGALCGRRRWLDGLPVARDVPRTAEEAVYV